MQQIHALWGIRLVRYGFVGGCMALLYAALVTGIAYGTGLPAGIASLGATAIVTPLTYFSHRWFTYRSENQVPKEFAYFVVMVIICFLLGAVIVTVLVDVMHVKTFIAGLIAAAVTPVSNYVMQARWVFVQRPRAVDP